MLFFGHVGDVVVGLLDRGEAAHVDEAGFWDVVGNIGSAVVEGNAGGLEAIEDFFGDVSGDVAAVFEAVGKAVLFQDG